MRLAKREVTDFDEIVDMLNRCQVAHLGINTDSYPYVVPVSFGYEVIDKTIIIYFHGAGEGRKAELFKTCGHVAVEFENFMGNMKVHFGYTTRYESVMGHGQVIKLEDDQKEQAMLKIMHHCGYPDFKDCTHLDHTCLFKIELEDVTAKRRL